MNCRLYFLIFTPIHKEDIRGGPLEIAGGGAKDFQCMNFSFSPSCLQDFFRHRKSFLGWWTACRNFLFENFPLREFHFGNCRPPHPAISNGPPLILAVRGYEFYLRVLLVPLFVSYAHSSEIIRVLFKLRLI